MLEETRPETVPEKKAPAKMEDKGFQDILKALIGKTVTVVNPESYEAAPMGFKLGEGYYRGKLTGLGRDYLVMMTQIERKKGVAEPVKQWIPMGRIKRISILKSEPILHL